jgi:hypothetical protein
MKRLLLLALVLLPVLSTSCFHHKKKPKENPAIASDVEETLKQRFIEKRSAELIALGRRPDLARQQAIDEFRDRYGYTHAAGK